MKMEGRSDEATEIFSASSADLDQERMPNYPNWKRLSDPQPPTPASSDDSEADIEPTPRGSTKRREQEGALILEQLEQEDRIKQLEDRVKQLEGHASEEDKEPKMPSFRQGHEESYPVGYGNPHINLGVHASGAITARFHMPGDPEEESTTLITMTRREFEDSLMRERLVMKQMMDDRMKDLEAKMKTLGQKQERAHNVPILTPLELEDPSPTRHEEFASLLGGKPAEDEDSEQEWHAPFGSSVYTLLYMCPKFSQGFFYGVFVVALQLITIVLTLVGILDIDAEENVIALRAMVDPIVTVTQGVALFMALAFQTDLIEAVLKLQDGHHPEVLEKHPGATFPTWIFSCLAQLVAGMLLLVTIFILTMQVEDVLSIMLNFAALHFMAEIDDIGFSLADMGFVTNGIQREIASVVDFQVPKRKSRNRCRRVLYILTMVGIFAGYGVLKRRQLDGEYLPTFIYVQFGDAYNPKIPYFSGILKSENDRTPVRRRYRDTGTEKILLAYCLEEKAWTFTEGNDPCNYFAKSADTTSYVVTSIPKTEWQVKDASSRLHPFDSFSLVARDCDPATCRGTCGTDGLCHCPNDQFGMDCEFSNVCTSLETDKRFDPFPSTKVIPLNGFSGISDSYQILKNSTIGAYIRVYSMPVYYSNNTHPANLIFFGGRRWILTSEWSLFNLYQAMEESPSTWFFPDRTVARLEDKFHAFHQANYTPLFISDPVDFATPNFLPTPAGLWWWQVNTVNETGRLFTPDVQLYTVLECEKEETRVSCLGNGFCPNGKCNVETGFCDVDPPCYTSKTGCNNAGVCDESTGVCRCYPPYIGNLCQDTLKCYEEDGKCLNGGICNVTSGLCTCTDPVTSGVACERRLSCLDFGCENGGWCERDSGKCVCRKPYYGFLCGLVNTTQTEFFCSDDKDCNNGACNMDTGVCSCKDPASFGTLCEHRYDCFQHGHNVGIDCQHSGTCNISTRICDCPEPYFGPDCSQVPPCLDDSDCNYNTCLVDTGKCECSAGRGAGKRCDQGWALWRCFADEECVEGICNGDGICECNPGYSGTLCESLVVSSEFYFPFYDEVYDQAVANTEQCGFKDPFGLCTIGYNDSVWDDDFLDLIFSDDDLLGGLFDDDFLQSTPETAPPSATNASFLNEDILAIDDDIFLNDDLFPANKADVP